MKLRMTLPLPPSLPNARLHWAAKNRKARNYELLCTASYAPRPREPYPHLTVNAHLFVHNIRDEDNAVASLKWTIDWLVKRGYIIDDSPAHMTLGTIRQTIDRKDKRLELELVP